MAAPSKLTAAAATTLPDATVTKVDLATEALAGDFRTTPPASGFKVPAGVTRVNFGWWSKIGHPNVSSTMRVLRGAGLTVIDSQYQMGTDDWESAKAARWVEVASADELTLHAFQNDGSASFVNDATDSYYFFVEEAADAVGKVATSRLRTTVATVIPGGNVDTLLTYDTVDIAGGFRGAGTPTNGFIVPADVTHIDISWFATVRTGNVSGRLAVRAKLNGTTLIGGIDDFNASALGTYTMGYFRALPVSEGDTVQLYGRHGGTDNRNANDAGGEYYFCVEDATP